MKTEQSALRRSYPRSWALELRAGALAPFLAVSTLRQHPSLFVHGALPFFLGLFWAFWSVLNALLPAPDGLHWLLAAARWLVDINLLIAVLLIAITSPVIDYLGFKTEICCALRRRKRRRRLPLPNLRSARYLTFMLSEAGKLFLFKTAVLLLALIPAQFPGPGRWMAGLMVGLTIALDFIDYPLTRRGHSFREKKVWVRRHWAALLGFCLVTWVLFIIPGFGGLMLLPIAISGTLLVVPERLLETSRPSA